MDLYVVILAAGKGTRMRSSIPKVLHPLANKPLLLHVIEKAQSMRPQKTIVVYGHGGETVKEHLAATGVEWVEQVTQLGTGHAVMQAMHLIPDNARVMILYGDVPLTRTETLQALLNCDKSHNDSIALLTATLDDPTGYGRIIRDHEFNVTHIVEQKDANESELEVNEVNTGILVASSHCLRHWLDNISNDNAQAEYYLTDIIAMAVSEEFGVATVSAETVWEILGVNDKKQLAELERHLQLTIAKSLLKEGVTLRDPARIDVRGTLTVSRDCEIDINCLFEGDVVLEEGVRIGANCHLKDVTVGRSTIIHPFSSVDSSTIAEECEIGPYARIRPDTTLASKVKIGNFVETKKATIGENSKVNHLSYIGDTVIGKRVNIGAGTITCNYDGANKHQTMIGDDVFVGSDTQLVAPVTIGNGATIGAGSTITKDAPVDELTLSRSKQISVPSWKRPVKKSK
ncbi:MAG: bifunctional UDP-N-acetylglucosamine diphosphorylase/glucosamine-1-phosphate N-acetyltransferase GlmU [Gammaproteobacteria bacterium]|nr:bifunctional UDP-N-acetylglucosamine diphosphorylase/glucosamine-1-phosphate N-acetyltransferase GlmU [Gammaproteobacteria bacterium]